MRFALGCFLAVLILPTLVLGKDIEEEKQAACRKCLVAAMIKVDPGPWCAVVDSCTVKDTAVSITSDEIFKVTPFENEFGCFEVEGGIFADVTTHNSETWDNFKFDGKVEVKPEGKEFKAEAKKELESHYGRTSGQDTTIKVNKPLPINCKKGTSKVEVTEYQQTGDVIVILEVKGRGFNGSPFNGTPKGVFFKPEDQIAKCLARNAGDVKPFTDSSCRGPAKVSATRFQRFKTGELQVNFNSTADCCKENKDKCCPGTK
jgi:hypothetical protein